jgi:hypothetical protein
MKFSVKSIILATCFFFLCSSWSFACNFPPAYWTTEGTVFWCEKEEVTYYGHFTRWGVDSVEQTQVLLGYGLKYICSGTYIETKETTKVTEMWVLENLQWRLKLRHRGSLRSETTTQYRSWADVRYPGISYTRPPCDPNAQQVTGSSNQETPIFNNLGPGVLVPLLIPRVIIVP